MATFDATGPATLHGQAATWRSPAGPVLFLGFERDYWRLLIRGSALLAVTLGIYRFWLTTDMRRFLWSNTQVLGEPLEYAGTARELLMGFLIAVAILIPFYALIFLLALTLGPIGQLAGVIAFALTTILGHYAVYRARRYRLTRTVYRGVRFHQTGSAWRYASLAVMWWTIVILTLGLAYPIAQSRLERFKMRNTWIGNLQGRFEGSATQLLIRGLLMWFVIVGPLIASLIAMAASFDLNTLDEILEELSSDVDEETLGRLIAARPGLAAAMGGAVGALVWSMMAAPLLYPAFQAMVLRWWISGLRFGDVSVTSHMRTGAIYGIYLRFVGWSIVILVMGVISAIIIGICFAVIGWVIGPRIGGMESMMVQIATVTTGLAGYVTFALTYSALYQVKVRLGLWRIVMDSVELTNPRILERISSVGAPASAVGEGLADALNVGGI